MKKCRGSFETYRGWKSKVVCSVCGRELKSKRIPSTGCNGYMVPAHKELKNVS